MPREYFESGHDYILSSHFMFTAVTDSCHLGIQCSYF